MTVFDAELGENDVKLLLRPYISEGISLPIDLFSQLTKYLQLLLKWNARTNLTAIREPEEMVRRHFGESLFAAQHLGGCATLLDFGSGAGFPGLPIQLFRPALQVTLAESQNKKAAFLREAVRTLELKTEVWAGRVETMPASRRFDVVALRAVDDMDLAIEAASLRATRRMLLLTTSDQKHTIPADFGVAGAIPIPDARNRQILFLDRVSPIVE